MAYFNSSSFLLIKRFWFHIEPRRKYQLAGLFLLMIFTSFIEATVVASVFPLLSLMLGLGTDAEQVFNKTISIFFEIDSQTNLIFILTLVLTIFVTLSAIAKLLLLWSSTNLTYKVGSDLGYKLFRKELSKPYELHILRNKSEFIDAAVAKTSSSVYCFLMALNLASSILMFIGIASVIVFINPKFSLAVISTFCLIYGLVVFLTKKKLIKTSESIATQSSLAIKSLNEGLGSIREIILSGLQDTFSKVYWKHDASLKFAQGREQFIGQSPRHLIEPIVILTLIFTVISLYSYNETLFDLMPFFATLILASQKLLPVMHQAFQSWSSIVSRKKSLAIIVDFLDTPSYKNPSNVLSTKLSFDNYIFIENLNFKYKESKKWIFADVNLKIKKGERLGIIGKSGSGKSTLVDCLAGLLIPQVGSIYIDDVKLNSSNLANWQSKIAYVPQNVFLLDASISENIAIGITKDRIHLNTLLDVVKKANLDSVISALPEGLDTIIGENGIRLSGGQRQRLAIARALYKNADIVILDEATSALDKETESQLINRFDEIDANVTVVIIAHSLKTLEKCTKVLEVVNGEIFERKPSEIK